MQNFESGFDHGFESMATFNGRDVGKNESAAASTSVSVPEKAEVESGRTD